MLWDPREFRDKAQGLQNDLEDQREMLSYI